MTDDLMRAREAERFMQHRRAKLQIVGYLTLLVMLCASLWWMS